MTASDSPARPEPCVFHLDDGQLWRGGQHQVWLLLNELRQKGIRQKLLAREGCPLTVRAREIGIEVQAIHYRGELDWRAPRAIASAAREFGANIIHTHTGHAHSTGLRVIRHLRDTAKLVTTRRVDFRIGRHYFSRLKYLRPNQHFIAISEGVRKVMIEGGVAPERVTLVHSGVPPIAPELAVPRETVRAELGIAGDEIAIVNMGALTDHKGQRYLVEAAPGILRHHPNARIHILGEGELRPTLEAMIHSLRLADRVIMHGYVNDARLKLAGFDIYVSSSHLEGLGTVNMDAMLGGLPVVAAAAGGVPEIVIDGETGRLVPAHDPMALGDAICAAIENPDDNRRMIDNARRHVEEKFSARAMAEGTLAVYYQLLGNS